MQLRLMRAYKELPANGEELYIVNRIIQKQQDVLERYMALAGAHLVAVVVAV